jgi:hypothetical protein
VAPPWQSHLPPHLCFVVNEQISLLGCESGVYLYSVQRTGPAPQDAGSVPTYLPVAVGKNDRTLESPNRWTDWPMTPLIFCDGRLVLCSGAGQNEVVLTAFTVPTTASDDPIDLHSSIAVQGLENIDVAFDFHNVGFCPMSGRLVHSLSNTSLQVCDFLLPLEDR